MYASNFSLPDYFDRIGFRGEASADIASISTIMRSQLFSVPFENLDVQAGKIVSLIPEEIVEKIVGRRRGGYCYEVNGIFAMALEAMHIPYQFVAARPMFYPTRRPKTHMAVLVHLQGEAWLCDLGFGSYGIRAPIRLSDIDLAIQQDEDRFMLTMAGNGEYLLKACVEDEWANQYAFDLSPWEWIDFMPANYLNSTHPEAIFVQKPLVVLHNPDGRKILFGGMLKTVANGKVTKQLIAKDAQASVLSSEFGLTVTA